MHLKSVLVTWTTAATDEYRHTFTVAELAGLLGMTEPDVVAKITNGGIDEMIRSVDISDIRDAAGADADTPYAYGDETHTLDGVYSGAERPPTERTDRDD